MNSPHRSSTPLRYASALLITTLLLGFSLAATGATPLAQPPGSQETVAVNPVTRAAMAVGGGGRGVVTGNTARFAT